MSPPHIAIAALCAEQSKHTELQRQLAEVSVGVVWSNSPDQLLDLLHLGGISLVLAEVEGNFADSYGDIHVWVSKIRQISTVPLILLHHDLNTNTRVNLLDSGVDLLVHESLPAREQASLVRAQLRRATYYLLKPVQDSWHEAQFDQIKLNLKTRALRGNGGESRLTEKEARLLVAMLRRPGEVVHRRQLAPEVTGRPWNPTERALDVHATHLRQKLVEVGAREDLIGTVRGVGYRIDTTPQWS